MLLKILKSQNCNVIVKDVQIKKLFYTVEDDCLYLILDVNKIEYKITTLFIQCNQIIEINKI